jgi:hypothetical protein
MWRSVRHGVVELKAYAIEIADKVNRGTIYDFDSAGFIHIMYSFINYV